MKKFDDISKVLIICVLIGSGLILTLLVDPLLLSQCNENREYLYASSSMGISMLPNIVNGDVLLILEVDSPNFNPSVGDVLVYQYDLNGKIVAVAHRIYSITENYYAVKGDNNREIERVYFEDVIGVVFDIAPRNPLGKALYSNLF